MDGDGKQGHPPDGQLMPGTACDVAAESTDNIYRWLLTVALLQSLMSAQQLPITFRALPCKPGNPSHPEVCSYADTSRAT